ERSVETVSLADFRQLKDKSLEQLQQRSNQGAQVHFLDSDRIAYLVYPAFNYSDDEKKKIEDIFKEVKAKKSHDLIIDIRGNGGGNSSMGDFIFTYLHEGTFCSFSKCRVRLSSEVLSSVAKAWEIPEDADIDGQVVTWRIGDQTPSKPKAFFTGRVFLLIDNGTFSSATDFAAMFRDYGVGEILGYETGGVPCCFGDIYPFSLKNSGISCGVSWKQFFCPKPRPGDDEHGVLPDIPMSDKLLRAYQKEDDPVLAFTLDHIRKTRR
ncbi:MAG: S41 family peptidase, partial [Armatimonadetes bacterium]|nr:S41 family peptidase [Armatimonadota bacterium]